jgi:RNA 2',3'-cyclic 3'-phosphodiesterase
MRLFYAVEAPPAVTRHAGAIRGAIEASAPEVARVLRWVSTEQLHLTMRFVGEVDDEIASPYADLLAEPFGVPPLECHALGPGWLPDPRRARVLVLGLGGDLAKLRELKAALDRRLRRLGLEPETRPFRAHLTLARVRQRDGSPRPDGAQAVVSVGAAVAPVPFTIDRLVLYMSRLSPRGPSYEALAVAPLEAGGDGA